MINCYLCNRPLQNGHRILKRGDVEASFAKCPSGGSLSASTSPEKRIDSANEPKSIFSSVDDVKVCWSQCSPTTAMLIQLAKKKLDEGETSSTPGLVIQDAPFDLGYLTYDPSRYMEFLEAKRNKVVANLSSCGFALPDVETFLARLSIFETDAD